MNNDADLLRTFVENRSEAAFAALVQRHIGLVYATALRRLNQDAHLADDVTQVVFTTLARKAPSLRDHASLAGWLFVSTQLSTAALVRREQRRKHRELAAHSMQIADSSDASDDYARLRPLLDDAIVELKHDEREAVVLRFFQQRTFAEIGSALRVTEEAARKRVDRAIEKLHAVLTRRGVTSTALALSSVLANAGTAAVPAALASKVAAIAVAEAGAATAFSIVASFASAVLPAAAALVAGTFLLVPQHRANVAATAGLARLATPPGALAALHAENQQLARTIADAHALERDTANLPAIRATLASLPTSLPTPAPITASNAVTVTPQGTLIWEGKGVTLDDFVANVATLHTAATNGESKLVIHAKGAGYAQMLYALDEARKAGIKHIVVESDVTPDPKFRFNWF